MKKVKIHNLEGKHTHGGEFEDEIEMQSWINLCVSKNKWGKKAGFYLESELSEVEKSQEISRVLVDEFGEQLMFPLIEIPSQYTVEIEDVSLEYELKNKISLRNKKRFFGENLIDFISVMNESKILTVDQVNSFMGNATISQLREHLWSGNIETFVQTLEVSDMSAFFTNEEKTNVISKCNQFLQSI